MQFAQVHLVIIIIIIIIFCVCVCVCGGGGGGGGGGEGGSHDNSNTFKCLASHLAEDIPIAKNGQNHSTIEFLGDCP